MEIFEQMVRFRIQDPFGSTQWIVRCWIPRPDSNMMKPVDSFLVKLQKFLEAKPRGHRL